MYQIDDDYNQAAPFIQYVIGQNVITISDEDAVVLTLCKWRFNKDGYAKGSINGKPVLMHRLIMERMLGRNINNGFVVDHINGNRSDNRRENLREVDTATNNRNRAKPLQDNSFKVKKIAKPEPITQDVKPVYGEKQLTLFDISTVSNEPKQLDIFDVSLDPNENTENINSHFNKEHENIIRVIRDGHELRWTTEQLKRLALFFIDLKFSRTEIIYLIWGFRGKRFLDGQELWIKLGLPKGYSGYQKDEVLRTNPVYETSFKSREVNRPPSLEEEEEEDF